MPCASRSHPLADRDVDIDDPTRTPPNPSVAVAVLPQLQDRNFQFECCKRTPVKLIRFRFICKKTSLGGRKQKEKKKKKTQVDFSRGVRSQPSNYAVYAPARTHVPTPRRFLSKPSAAFYVYLFLLLFLCDFFCMLVTNLVATYARVWISTPFIFLFFSRLFLVARYARVVTTRLSCLERTVWKQWLVFAHCSWKFPMPLSCELGGSEKERKFFFTSPYVNWLLYVTSSETIRFSNRSS